MTTAEQQLWLGLLDFADTLKHVDAHDNKQWNALVAELNTLTETYDRQFDPADEFKEYVATALLKSLGQLLGQLDRKD